MAARLQVKDEEFLGQFLLQALSVHAAKAAAAAAELLELVIQGGTFRSAEAPLFFEARVTQNASAGRRNKQMWSYGEKIWSRKKIL